MLSLFTVEKFFPLFSSLYWSVTWRQLFLSSLDGPVIYLGELPMGSFQRLNVLPLFGAIFLLLVSVLLLWGLFSICILIVLWPTVFFLGCSLLCLMLLRCVLLFSLIMFCLVFLRKNCALCLGLLSILLMLLSSAFGVPVMIFVTFALRI